MPAKLTRLVVACCARSTSRTGRMRAPSRRTTAPSCMFLQAVRIRRDFHPAPMRYAPRLDAIRPLRIRRTAPPLFIATVPRNSADGLSTAHRPGSLRRLPNNDVKPIAPPLQNATERILLTTPLRPNDLARNPKRAAKLLLVTPGSSPLPTARRRCLCQMHAAGSSQC